MKRRPIRKTDKPTYPEYREFAAERRKVVRLLGLGGAAVAVGGLAGCDSVRDLLGIGEEQQLDGEIACPTPANATPTWTTGDEPVTEEPITEMPEPEEATPAKPEEQMRGRIRSTEPAAPVKTSHPEAKVGGGMPAPDGDLEE